MEKNSRMTSDKAKDALYGMVTPEESLGITTEEYNKIVDACIYGDNKEESDNKAEDYLERIAIDRVDKLIGKEVMSCVTLSDAEECYIQGYKDGSKFPITKFMGEHPITEEGLDKAWYRLAYEDGYRQCIKAAADEWLFSHLQLYVTTYFDEKFMDMERGEFIRRFRKDMEEKL